MLFGIVILTTTVVALYVWYARIVAARNKVGEALGTIDAQLQQRHDLLPKVLAIAKRFLDHEEALLTEIIELRARAKPQVGERDFVLVGEKFETETALGMDLRKLFALAEGYPELTSSGPMIEAQRTFREVEANIAAARRFYNGAVNSLRNNVEVFPGQLLALPAGVQRLPPFFRASDWADKPISARDAL